MADIQRLPVRAVVGKTISKLYLAHESWRGLKSGSKAPSSAYLFNFEIQTSRGKLLVLDPYGNELVPPSLEKRLLRVEPGEYTLAVSLKTGLIYMITFGKEGRKYVAVASPFDPTLELPEGGYRIPSQYLDRELKGLRSAKRPYCIDVDSTTLMSFIDQESCLAELRENVAIHLDMRPLTRLEIRADGWRALGEWQDFRNPVGND